MTTNQIRPETFFTDLVNHAGQIGYQMSNRYVVFVHGPGREAFERTSSDPTQYGPPNPDELRGKPPIIGSPISPEWKKRLALNCVAASLPGKSVETQLFTVYGPTSKMPYVENYTNEITLTFNCSLDMFERKYFTGWQGLIVNADSNSLKFYSDYAKDYSITVMVLPRSIGSFQQLSADKPSDTQTNIRSEPYDILASSADAMGSIYFIHLQECYPIQIMEQELSYENGNAILKFQVRMAFARWFDPISQYDLLIQDRIRSYATDSNSIMNIYGGVSVNDPDKIVGIRADGYADRGKILETRNIEMTKDRVGLEPIIQSPFQKLISYTRDIIRYSNPKELRQLVADKGIEYLGDQFGIENVEGVAQAGQITDVFLKSGKKNLAGIRDRLLTPLSNIRNSNLPSGPGIRDLF
jgi:hypothetical protein